MSAESSKCLAVGSYPNNHHPVVRNINCRIISFWMPVCWRSEIQTWANPRSWLPKVFRWFRLVLLGWRFRCQVYSAPIRFQVRALPSSALLWFLVPLRLMSVNENWGMSGRKLALASPNENLYPEKARINDHDGKLHWCVHRFQDFFTHFCCSVICLLFTQFKGIV